MPIQHRFRINLLSVVRVLISVLIIFFVSQSLAEEMSYGEMAGIIRSAGRSYARVLDLQRTGENSWSVQRNFGSFYVTRDADGKFSINSSDQ